MLDDNPWEFACKDFHQEARRHGTRWPNRDALQKATTGRFARHSQTGQRVVHAFLGAVESNVTPPPPTGAIPTKTNALTRYSGRRKPWPCLPHPSCCPRPGGFPNEPIPAKIIGNGIGYELHAGSPLSDGGGVSGAHHASVDLGQIHPAAVTTDTGQGLIVSGRGIRSEKRRHNIVMRRIRKKQTRCQKGSGRSRRLAQAQRRDAVRSERRGRDLRHKGTRQVIAWGQTHHVGTLYVGNPAGVRAVSKGRHQNQRMAQGE